MSLREQSKKFIVQQHKARNEHWDFRLQTNGKMESWALPKGPTMNPADRKLAIMTKPHSLKYSKFEGIIDKGLYGAGKVLQWDNGNYKITKGSIKSGFFEFEVTGKKLKGTFVMVKTSKGWMFIKKKDRYARDVDIAKKKPYSVKSGKTIKQITENDGFITNDKDLGF